MPPAKQGLGGCAIGAIIIGAVLLIALIGLFFVGRSLIEDAGTIFDTFPVGAEADWDEVEVGDCVNFVDAIEEGEDTLVSTLELVDCFEPHDAEVYSLFDLADGRWPGADEAYFEGDAVCYDRFEEYVGIDYLESYYFYEVYTPTPESWEVGDRTVACTLVDPSGLLTKPLRGSGE